MVKERKRTRMMKEREKEKPIYCENPELTASFVRSDAIVSVEIKSFCGEVDRSPNIQNLVFCLLTKWGPFENTFSFVSFLKRPHLKAHVRRKEKRFFTGSLFISDGQDRKGSQKLNHFAK